MRDRRRRRAERPPRRSSAGSGTPAAAGPASPAVGGSDGSKSSENRACAANPTLAARRARSSTSWMFSGCRCAGRRSPNASTRSTSLPIRAASVWIRLVSSRSASPSPISSSCAAPGDPRQRVADLVRQHRRHPGHRARRRPVPEAAVHLVGHALRMHQQQHLAVAVLQRRRMDVLRLRRLVGPADDHVVLRHRHAALARLAHHVEHGAVHRRDTCRAACPPSAGSRSQPKLSAAGLADTIVSSAAITSAG